MIPLRNLRFGLPNEVQRLVGRGILARIVQEDQVASTASAGPSTSAQLLANALRLFGVVVSVVGTTLMQAEWAQGAEVN